MNTFELLMNVDRDALSKAPEKKVYIKRLSEITGSRFEVTIRAIPGQRFTEIATSAVDEDGNADSARSYEANIVTALEAIVEPDLKNKELLEHFGCITPKDLLQKLFLGGEIARIAGEVTELSGYGKDDEEKVKN